MIFRGIHLTGARLLSDPPRSSRGWAVQGRGLAAVAGRLPLAGSGPGVEHEVPVAHGLVGDGQFEDAVEEQAAASRAAAVEPEDELVEVVGQVRVVGGPPWWVPSNRRLASEATRWTPGSVLFASRPAAGRRWWR